MIIHIRIMSLKRISGVPFLQFGGTYVGLHQVTIIRFKDANLLSSPCVKVKVRGEELSYTYNKDTDEYKNLRAVFEKNDAEESVLNSVDSSNGFPTYSNKTRGKH